MDEFCGDVKHAWGPTAKGYLTHCFDDVVLFGFTVGQTREYPLPPPSFIFALASKLSRLHTRQCDTCDSHLVDAASPTSLGLPALGLPEDHTQHGQETKPHERGGKEGR